MARAHLPTRVPRPRTLVLAALVMFAVAFSLREWVFAPNFRFPLLYGVPIAVIAIACGLRAGLAAAAGTLVLYAIGDVTAPMRSHGMIVYTSGTDYLSAALRFGLLAGVLGWYSDRVRMRDNELRSLIAGAPDATVIVDDRGRVLLANRQTEKLLGYTHRELLALTLEALVPERFRAAHAVHRDGFFADPRARPMSTGLELYALRKDGREIPVEISLSDLRTERGTLAAAAIRDVTERRRYEERLRHMAEHDALTGLLNRHRFERELDAHRARILRYGGAGALIVLDLDHFKLINDTLGHSSGDAVINRAAAALRGRLRETDVLSRFGGDEFAVLLPQADAPEAQLVAAELLAALRAETVDLGGRARPLAASAGIALLAPDTGLAGEDVLVNADLAMYEAKDAGGDRAALYRPGGRNGTPAHAPMSWAQRIGAALERDLFTLLAQPIVDLGSGRVTQRELLLRMRDERGELVAPESFLYVAERLGIVQEIDRWVTEQAISILAGARARGEELTLEVNLSGLSIGDPALLALVRRELERTDVPPGNLIFEVTETAAVVKMSRAGRFARELADLGCRFALDDFGAGYGSFYYLKHLPFDFLKIDGEFVKGCRTSETDRLLVKAAVDIAAGLGRKTIAEFVGDEETARLVADLGVDYGQGFYLGAPEPLSADPLTRSG